MIYRRITIPPPLTSKLQFHITFACSTNVKVGGNAQPRV
jgi:hypothetical protein